jgi:hypothetical protein
MADGAVVALGVLGVLMLIVIEAFLYWAFLSKPRREPTKAETALRQGRGGP